MKYQAFLAVALATTGCISEAPETDTEESEGIIFPEEELPDLSCSLNIPLNCPSMINYNFSARASYVNDTRVNRAISDTAVAVISADGKDMQCQPASATEVKDIPMKGVFLPTGVTADVNASNRGVYFHGLGGGSVALGNTRFSPQNPVGTVSCSLLCDTDSPDATACTNAPNPNSDNGTITIAGRSQSVELDGTVQSKVTDPLTGLTSSTCKLTLPASRVAVQKFARPRDIIAVNKKRFVRGYDLTGTALRNACDAISRKVCGNSSSCVTTKTNECVTEFSQPDPCDFTPPR